MFDIVHNQKPVLAFKLQDIASNTTTVGESLDQLGFNNGPLYIPILGTLADIAGVWKPFVDSASGFGTETELTDASHADNLLGSTLAQLNFTEADDDKVGAVQIKGRTERYHRIKLTSTSVTGANIVGCIAIFGHPGLQPVTVPNFA